jgi:hypothetical protein
MIKCNIKYNVIISRKRKGPTQSFCWRSVEWQSYILGVIARRQIIALRTLCGEKSPNHVLMFLKWENHWEFCEVFFLCSTTETISPSLLASVWHCWTYLYPLVFYMHRNKRNSLKDGYFPVKEIEVCLSP